MAKNKLAKFAEMATFPNVIQMGDARELYHHDHDLKGQWHECLFGNDHPITLEIGCGKGEYTVEMAKHFPNRNFIGLDIKGARMWHGAKKALEDHLCNVAFFRTYAECLGSIFAPGEIDEIWITFPDPQMSNTRKRLTGCRFLTLYRQFLKPGGIIHLKTDSPFLYAYTSALIAENELSLYGSTDDLHGEGKALDPIDIRTFYEQQWLLRGKKIKYICFSIDGTAPLAEPSAEIEKDDYHSEARFMGQSPKSAAK